MTVACRRGGDGRRLPPSPAEADEQLSLLTKTSSNDEIGYLLVESGVQSRVSLWLIWREPGWKSSE